MIIAATTTTKASAYRKRTWLLQWQLPQCLARRAVVAEEVGLAEGLVADSAEGSEVAAQVEAEHQEDGDDCASLFLSKPQAATLIWEFNCKGPSQLIILRLDVMNHPFSLCITPLYIVDCRKRGWRKLRFQASRVP